MSLEDFEAAMRLIEENEDLADFVGSRDPALVDKAEKALGMSFPPSYRQFLLRLGAGSFGALEIYGVIDDEWEASSVPDAIWYTLNERDEFDLPKHLLVIAAAGDGPLYCLKLGQEKEPPVIFYLPGLEEEERDSGIAAEDFGAFLLEGVRDELDAWSASVLSRVNPSPAPSRQGEEMRYFLMTSPPSPTAKPASGRG